MPKLKKPFRDLIRSSTYRAFLVRKWRAIFLIIPRRTSSKGTVRKEILKVGIKIRVKFQHHGRPAQVKFGQKKKLGKREKHQKEQRVIKMVTYLREQGLSLRAIAKSLNELKIPTKNQGKKWHPEMVRRYLK